MIIIWVEHEKSYLSNKNEPITSNTTVNYDKNVLLTDYKYPWLFRISRLNYEKKQSFIEKIKKGQEEVTYLDEDIRRIDKELIKIRTKRSQIEIKAKVNQAHLNISDELYNIYFIPAMEEKKARKEAKQKLAAAWSTPATNDSSSEIT